MITAVERVLKSKTWPCTARNVRLARHWVCELLDPIFGSDRETVDRAGTCVGELLANAYEHSDSRALNGQITVTVIVRHRAIRIEVLDAGSASSAPHVHPEIVACENAATQESGRGMLMVEALADQWGDFSDEIGRTVWIELLADTS